jgi:drug/metabolite transporter (DMT)-like permease
VATPLRVVVLCLAALTGFAANSLLSRAALLNGAQIDPAMFTAVRIVSGALTLGVIVTIRARRSVVPAGNWPSAAALFLYAIAFSFAYVRLTTSTGALILFGVVQVTMLAFALRSGERPGPTQVIGLLIALTGLVILCAPGVRAPDPLGAALMLVAGCAWAAYSLRGRGSRDPLTTTAGNFLRAVPFVVVPLALSKDAIHLTRSGALLAIASGALASGVGYTLWYAALPHLTATRAAIVQLSVPLIAAAGGVLLLKEALSMRLVIAASATLGGVLLAMRKPQS